MSCLKCKENKDRYSNRITGYHNFLDTTDYLWEGKIVLVEKDGRVIYRECASCQVIWVEQNTAIEKDGDPYNGYKTVFTDLRAHVIGDHEYAFVRKRIENKG